MHISKLLYQTDIGITINIRVNTKSSRQGPQKIKQDQLVWGISAIPEDGKANLMLINQIAKLFSIPKSNISIIKGEKSKDKVILMQSIDSGYILNELDKLGFE